MRRALLSFALLAVLFGAAVAAKFDDKITELPNGRGTKIPLGASTYGGFVTVDAKNGGALYYWCAWGQLRFLTATGKFLNFLLFRVSCAVAYPNIHKTFHNCIVTTVIPFPSCQNAIIDYFLLG
jgi:hypothetical protein